MKNKGPRPANKSKRRTNIVFILAFVLFTLAYIYHLILQTHHENHSLQLLEILDQNQNEKYKLATEQSYGFFYDVTDEHWQKYKDIYNTHVNHYNMSAPLTFHPSYSQRKAHWFNSPEAWYQTNYEPNFSCPFEKRIGYNMNGDGPKWVCDPHRIKKLAIERKAKDANHPGCVIYSIGSNGDFNFELGMQQELGEGTCEIHIFDPGAYGHLVPKELKRTFYHQWALEKQQDNVTTPEKGLEKYGLKDIIKLLGHEHLDVIDVFKIDCEKCEWRTYMDWLAVGIPMLHQIQVEVHGAPGGKVIDFFDTFEKNGYLRFHKEPNIQFDSTCLEYAFLKVDPAFMEGKIV